MSDALLLDTHIWVWGAEGRTGLVSPATIDATEAARRTGSLLVSAISVWEVAMLESRGRVHFGTPLHDWIRDALTESGVRLLPLDPEIAIEATRLPGAPHADPADRILMASARVTGAPLVTCDARILGYAAAGHVPVLDARP